MSSYSLPQFLRARSRQAHRYRTFLFLFATVVTLFALARARAQDSPLITVDEECTAMAYAPDGRIAFSVRHAFSQRHFDMQRDDFWILSPDGKRRKIFNGEKFIRGDGLFSYLVTAIRWSPDSSRLAAELLTSQVIDQDGNTKEGVATLLLDDTGREIKLSGSDSLIPDASDAAWLADNSTVVYLKEVAKPKLLFSLNSARVTLGAGHALFAGRTFSAVAWLPNQNAALAVERGAPTGPPRLVKIELANRIVDEIAMPDGFTGGLSVSPSAAKVAYYRDHEVLEIRDLRSGGAVNNVASVRVGLGVYQWRPDEHRILLKRAPEHKSGDLVWFDVPSSPTAPSQQKTPDAGLVPVREVPLTPAIRGIAFRDFAISPNGKFLAVIQTGRRNLQIFPLN